MNDGSLTRRRVIQAMLATPVLAGLGPASAFGQDSDELITAADKALDVFDFERLARAKLPPAHFGYLATGVDGDATLKANAAGFSNYSLRVRRLIDVSKIDMSVSLFGTNWDSPIVIDPVGSQRAFHPDGELATARAAKSRKHLQILSTVSSTGVEDVAAARGAPIWYQLYPTDQWSVTQALVRRAEAAGCPAIVLTVDAAAYPRNNETLKLAMQSDSRQCSACHVNNNHDMCRHAPLFSGLDVSRVSALQPAQLTPAFLGRLRQAVKGRLIVKGIATGEDAALALEQGADAVIVSNHGGRNEESLRATIDCLPEVVAAVKGHIPVLLDSGVRRGTDLFKALALGASAVGIGRPYVWGLAAFGQSGVEAVIDILNRELVAIMRQAGTPSLADISAARVLRSRDG